MDDITRSMEICMVDRVSPIVDVREEAHPDPVEVPHLHTQ